MLARTSFPSRRSSFSLFFPPFLLPLEKYKSQSDNPLTSSSAKGSASGRLGSKEKQESLSAALSLPFFLALVLGFRSVLRLVVHGIIISLPFLRSSFRLLSYPSPFHQLNSLLLLPRSSLYLYPPPYCGIVSCLSRKYAPCAVSHAVSITFVALCTILYHSVSHF